jgi:cell division initiation protein
MTMTPQDIQAQQFHVRFRGFDVEEVDAFLERVAEEFLVLQEENRQLTEQVEALKKEIDSYHHQEKAFQSAIISAQQIAEEMKAKSRRVAEEITAAAKEEARQLHQQANAEIVGLEAEVDRLKEMKQQAGQELRRMLRGYLDQLEGGEEMPAPAVRAGKSAPPPVNAAAAPVIAAESAMAEEAPVVDLSDLYERIELTDEEFAAVGGASLPMDSDEEVRDLFAIGDAEETGAIPDLEGDMLFTLEDPLDEEGPAVSFEEEPEGQGKGRK